ncbi:MAG: 2-haloacid dehalogenase, partial [Thermoleophilaceae bacterium]|nr:2-haloacid dehalogenase [Thermoleophilaceae bacterium]
MPLPKEVRFVTFDCYGTLIDWETGVWDAFEKEASRDGFDLDRDELLTLF